MVASYVLAIDQGTTSSRVLLFDRDGMVRASERREFEQLMPHVGWVQHDPMVILSSVQACCEGAMRQVGATKDDIAAIGITNQRDTTVAWDRATGEPLCNAIVWNDLRTTDKVAAQTKAHGKMRHQQVTGLPFCTYWPAVKMRCLLDNEPAVQRANAERRCMFGTVDSWLIYRLTGGADGGIHITDVSNASRYMLMDLRTRSWDQDICGELGIPMHTLPEIRSNSEVYGYVRGFALLEGVPISGALGDQQAALLGQGCLTKGSCKNTFGTCCALLVNTGSDVLNSESGLTTTLAWQLGPKAAPTYALEGTLGAAGRTVQWLRDNLGVIRSASEIEKLAASVPDCAGVTLVPAFCGLLAPMWRDDARAVLVGMGTYTRREHICRAVLESVAFSNADILEAVRKDTGLQLGSVRVDGGMTVNRLLMQMQADIYGASVLRASICEATSLGAALAAGLAVGFYSSVEDVHLIHKRSGGYEAFQPAMDMGKRLREIARWHDAMRRSLKLEKWQRGAAPPHQEEQEEEEEEYVWDAEKSSYATLSSETSPPADTGARKRERKGASWPAVSATMAAAWKGRRSEAFEERDLRVEA